MHSNLFALKFLTKSIYFKSDKKAASDYLSIFIENELYRKEQCSKYGNADEAI